MSHIKPTKVDVIEWLIFVVAPVAYFVSNGWWPAAVIGFWWAHVLTPQWGKSLADRWKDPEGD